MNVQGNANKSFSVKDGTEYSPDTPSNKIRNGGLSGQVFVFMMITIKNRMTSSGTSKNSAPTNLESALNETICVKSLYMLFYRPKYPTSTAFPVKYIYHLCWGKGELERLFDLKTKRHVMRNK